MPRRSALLSSSRPSPWPRHSLCCPARAPLLNGQYAHNHGAWANTPPHRGLQAFDDTRTVATGPTVPYHRRDAPDLLHEPEGPSRLRFAQGVRTPRYLDVEYASHERELYDVRADPDQLRNRAADPALSVVTRRLARVLDRMRTCAGATCAEPLPAPLRGAGSRP